MGKLSVAYGLPFLTVGLAAQVCAQVITSRTCVGSRWERNNYRNRKVNLSGGLSLGLSLSALSIFEVARRPLPSDLAPALAASVVVLVATGCGLVDDLDQGASEGKQSVKGLRGHLVALKEGRVTTGVLKMAGIGAGAAVSALIIGMPQRRSLADWFIDSALIAGSANLFNLFDLRPGRALKAAGLTLITVGACSGGKQLPATLGVITAALPTDLGETTMLGDTGANALGAKLGVLAASCSARPIRIAGLAGVLALIFLSEKISFSRIIDSNQLLRAIDLWGREP